MKVVIAGGTGFIGRELTRFLLKEGHELVILTRRELPSEKNLKFIGWMQDGTLPEKEIGKADVFINLAGTSINEGRWTVKHKKRIYQSRMETTGELLRIITALPEKPSVLVNASAIGIYPSSLGVVYTENSSEKADNFLARTVSDWERKASLAEELGIRVVNTRFGVVLGREGGALPVMALPYKLFVGGTLGSGNQWVSWIHIVDAVRAILFVIQKEHLHGPVNITSIFPTRMKDFGKMLASVMHRPHWLPIPAFILKLALGQKSSLILASQLVLPEVLTTEGFEFAFPTLERALTDLFKRTKEI